MQKVHHTGRDRSTGVRDCGNKMVHLPIHLANEVRLGGPVQFRWMYPPERYMCILKSYVRNKSCPEDSIAEAYLAEKCLAFCSRYLHGGVQTRLNKRSRNDDDPNEDEVVPSKLFSNKGRSLVMENGEPINLDDISNAQPMCMYYTIVKKSQIMLESMRKRLTISGEQNGEKQKFTTKRLCSGLKLVRGIQMYLLAKRIISRYKLYCKKIFWICN
ncbi:uncharacterized protein LOC127745701 [Arachis duranensis]|uniref:Uncharacterized protein LOC127745701 n=1 Tax=Arachis duranensis TaxID=130453 RepID=A0A9C6TR91_ARADU|nr:uncharacterized protein LOC127745701 [Arachis duranensis]